MVSIRKKAEKIFNELSTDKWDAGSGAFALHEAPGSGVVLKVRLKMFGSGLFLERRKANDNKKESSSAPLNSLSLNKVAALFIVINLALSI